MARGEEKRVRNAGGGGKKSRMFCGHSGAEWKTRGKKSRGEELWPVKSVKRNDEK